MQTAHAMSDCEMYVEQTLGVLKPKTFGGMNGDISRKHFRKEINEFIRLQNNSKNYVKFMAIGRQLAFAKRSNLKISSEDMKFYRKNFDKFKRVTLRLPDKQ